MNSERGRKKQKEKMTSKEEEEEKNYLTNDKKMRI
jgi:hypothetical protein